MPRFASFDGTQLAYEIEGDGYPVLLLHGFVADSFMQWVRPGVSERLRRSGRKVVLLDNRGHGMSAKPHEPEAYGGDTLERDALALLDHLGVERCDVAGYSMGAGLVLRLVTRHPERFRSAVVAGIGGTWASARGRAEGEGPRTNPFVDAMTVEDKSTIASPIARSFRDFADTVGADRKAMAAFQSASRDLGAAGELGSIAMPVLVLAAEGDPLAANPETLAEAIPGAKCVVVPGTHLNVVNNPAFQDALVGFVTAQS